MMPASATALPGLPPAVQGWFDAMVSRAERLPQKRALAAQVFLRKTSIALARLGEWFEASGGEDAERAALVTLRAACLAGLDRALTTAPKAPKARKVSKARGTKTASARKPPSKAEAWALLRQISQASSLPLVWVPDLVRGLVERGATKEWCWTWLHEEQRRRTLELRAEGGVGRLSPVDRELCPLNYDKIPLSHVLITGGSESAPSLEAFAAAVNAASKETKHGRWLSGKVFISAVHQELIRRRFEVGALDAFKRRLVQAHEAGRLLLSRGDLVASLPADLRDESYTKAGTREFHYVETEHLP